MNAPHFVIAGSAKSGTTALHYMLDQHPRVHMSAVKETNYFVHGFECSRALKNLRGEGMFAGVADDDFINSDAKYRALFAGAGAEIICGEASPLYLINPQVPARLLAHRPDMKVVVILRNPADVAFANYLHHLRVGSEPLPFDAVDGLLDESRYLGDGLHPFCDHLKLPAYASHLPHYVNALPPEQFRCLIYEEFLERRSEVVAELFDWLGVASDAEINVEQRVNVSGMPKSRLVNDLIYGSEWAKKLMRHVVPKKTRRKARSILETWNTGKKLSAPATLRRELDARYEADVAYVEDLLGRTIEPWRRLRQT